jgi:hypothetical protein
MPLHCDGVQDWTKCPDRTIWISPETLLGSVMNIPSSRGRFCTAAIRSDEWVDANQVTQTGVPSDWRPAVRAAHTPNTITGLPMRELRV